ncbi:MAG: GNAT family N-acetyltransferase [Clostridia bacterium]|nr:GNAT family N-acetyltransferase [Clostridia bacterium]
MKIREATLADCPTLDALLSRLIRDEAQYDANLDPAVAVTDNYASRLGLEGHKLFLAEEGGEVVAFLYGFICHVEGIFQKPVAVLDALFVDEGHRRRGCATVLVDAFKAFARERGACRVELKALTQNEAALRLYESLSFSEMKKYLKCEL